MSMTRESALKFDAQLSAIPLYVPGTIELNPERHAFIARDARDYAARTLDDLSDEWDDDE